MDNLYEQLQALADFTLECVDTLEYEVQQKKVVSFQRKKMIELLKKSRQDIHDTLDAAATGDKEVVEDCTKKLRATFLELLEQHKIFNEHKDGYES